jgi:hypothetical protein
VPDFRDELESLFHILNDSPYPPFQPNGLQDTHLGQFQICLKIVSFVSGGWKTKFRLENAHFVEVDIYHRLFQFGQTQARRLNAIPIGNVYEINSSHLCLLNGTNLKLLK